MTSNVTAAHGVSPTILGKQGTPESISRSFYGKRFKALSVMEDALFSLVRSVFYKLLSFGCSVVGQKSAHHRYRDLAYYNYSRMGNRPLTYAIYGDKVVNFAMNSTGIPGGVKRKNVNEFKELKKIYGKLFEKMRCAASSDDFPILETKLSRHPIDQGICLGASLDFISRYLKGNSDCKFETIAKISEEFSEKGTPQAQITQILYEAQDTKSLLQKQSFHKDKLIKELHKNTEEVSKKFDERRSKIKEEVKKLKESARTEFVQKEILNALSEFQNAINEMRSNVDNKIAAYDAELDCERLQSVAKGNDLHLQLIKVVIADPKQKIAPPLFKSYLSHLSEGAYLVCLSKSTNSRSGHAVAFIKTEHETYLFDPNFATLIFQNPQKLARELWRKRASTMEIYKSSLGT